MPVPATPAGKQLRHSPPSHTLVRRTKSEGHVLEPSARSAVPEVCTDATTNDRLWSRLDGGSHRNSVSSSSSISSSDTVIDLSLPNLAARKGLAGARPDPPWAACRRSCDTQPVGKSKSNPDLQEGLADELRARPLRPAPDDSPSSGRPAQRRHTWSRLYMEGLKQSAAAGRPSPAAATGTGTTPGAASMSKSLGDLTSDDIACTFEGKYRSISRSFVVRPAREQLRRAGPHRSRPPDQLTERLRQLTDVEPLTASDFDRAKQACEEQEAQEEEESLVRRTSSRSQSRVRYIANRAKKAQERQRLLGLAQGRSASFSLTGLGGGGSPIEERGNPEGACCVSLPSPCTHVDLLSQLAPPGAPASPQLQSSPDSDNSEVFFRLRL